MLRFLFTTLPSNDLGLLTRSLPIACELAKQGHLIAFCSPGTAPSRLIDEAGFDNLLPRHPIYHFMAAEFSPRGVFAAIKSGRREFGLFSFLGQLLRSIPARMAPSTAEVWNMDHFWALTGMLNESFVRASCDALKGLMVDWAPDVVVDFWNPFACIAARAIPKPLVTVIQTDMHPDSQGFIWWKEPPPDLPTPVPLVNRVLAENGLASIVKTEELFVGDLTLALGSRETDPLPDTADVTYVGPVLWQKTGAKLPAWIDEISADKPLIWLYSGNPRYIPLARTWSDSAVVLQAGIAALADEDVHVVVTTGHHALPKTFLPLPANFRHVPFVPGLAMAGRSDLLIHHGGYGSCQTGLHTGTPAVIIPTYSERESNARRVAAVGAGEFVLPTTDTSGKKKQVDPAVLREKVWKVLSEPSYAARAMRISEKMRKTGGVSKAARLIEGFAERRETT